LLDEIGPPSCLHKGSSKAESSLRLRSALAVQMVNESPLDTPYCLLSGFSSSGCDGRLHPDFRWMPEERAHNELNQY
jgi:hypothetical protein